MSFLGNLNPFGYVRNFFRSSDQDGMATPDRAASPQKPFKTPMELVDEVTEELKQLKERVDVFSGDSNAKEYLFLDEMLTRLLLNLDNIDTQGLEDVRAARRIMITAVQDCLNVLESKVVKDGQDNARRSLRKKSKSDNSSGSPKKKNRTQR